MEDELLEEFREYRKFRKTLRKKKKAKVNELRAKSVIDLDSGGSSDPTSDLLNAFGDESVTDIEIIKDNTTKTVAKKKIMSIVQKSTGKVTGVMSLMKAIFWASLWIAKLFGLQPSTGGVILVLVTHLYRWYLPQWLSESITGLTHIYKVLDNVIFAMGQTGIRIKRLEFWTLVKIWWNVVTLNPEANMEIQYPTEQSYYQRASNYARGMSDYFSNLLFSKDVDLMPQEDVGLLTEALGYLNNNILGVGSNNM